MKNLDESQDEDARPNQKNRHYLDPKNDPDVTFDDVRLTRYDKARAKLRDAEAKRDAILAMPERDADAVRRLLVVEKAIERHQNAVTRALTNHQQRLDEIDRYRAEKPNDEYNAKRRVKRRKVRQHENVDLSGMGVNRKRNMSGIAGLMRVVQTPARQRNGRGGYHGSLC